VIVGLL